MKILVTGAAGFIGFHLCQKLISRGDDVVALDNLNDYYDVNLKWGRLKALGLSKEEVLKGRTRQGRLLFVHQDLTEAEALQELFAQEHFDAVVNLAAQAGVRYSLTNPEAYVQSNVVGFLNLLEAARRVPVAHFVYASSSSVYGANSKVPFSTSDTVDHPVSLYAATKKSNELMAYTYSHLYGIPVTGLRFFTVYGPWGRPDMALFLFTEALLYKRPLKIFNHGEMWRDFTYIEDILEGLVRVLDHPAQGQPPAKVYNLGCGSPVKLTDFIDELERQMRAMRLIRQEPQREYLPLQPGDVPVTHADVSELVKDFGYQPKTSVHEGIKEFLVWYKNYHGLL